MTETQTFIEDAVRGRYEHKGDAFPIESLVLDPEWWQAVGRTRGWTWGDGVTEPVEPNWNHEWHRFIDHLADGLSIEDSLTKLK